MVAAIAIQAPRMHYSYIRNHVKKNLFTITNPERTHGGTGFQVKAPSGKPYILTNAHVCGVGVDGNVSVTDENGNTIKLKIIESSNFTDLCVVEAYPGVEGLSIASNSNIGEIVYTVGHPKLYPTTLSQGEFIGVAEVEVLDHILKDKKDEETCKLPKNRIKEIDMFFFKLKACIIDIYANYSNIIILPGNSGSPTVNFYGNLVGVAFAGDNDAHWGLFITLNDIHKFLEKY